MNTAVIKTDRVRELSNEELDLVSGGNWSVGAFGYTVSYLETDAVGDWIRIDKPDGSLTLIKMC